jgi:hypothetical protein
MPRTGIERCLYFGKNALCGSAAPARQHIFGRQPAQCHPRKAAVASATSPTGTIRFKHHGVKAVLMCEMVRTRKACVTASDYRDVGINLSGRRAVIRCKIARCSGPV